ESSRRQQKFVQVVQRMMIPTISFRYGQVSCPSNFNARHPYRMNCLARTFHFQGISAAEINILQQIRIIENVIMKIEHVAIWTTDLVTLRDFYVHYFDAVAGDRYVNPRTRFESYFLSFKEGARL